MRRGGLIIVAVAASLQPETAAASHFPQHARGAVVYEVGAPATSGSIVRSSASGAVVINVRRGSGFAGPQASFKLKGDPRSVLVEMMGNVHPVQSQARLVEDYFRRLGIVVPAGFSEQTLFGMAAPIARRRTGDLLYYAGVDGRAPAHVAILLEPDRLVYYNSGSGKVEHAQLGHTPWEGRFLFTRRILGTVFAGYLRRGGGGPSAPHPSKPKPAPLPEHYETEMAGIASLYGNGDGSHGKETANGERYDEEALTAAHRTLPFHTWLLVTNVDNGRRVIVRVNDRGPFAQKERVIDLSYRAARLLGMDHRGTARVKLSVIRVATENR